MLIQQEPEQKTHKNLTLRLLLFHFLALFILGFLTFRSGQASHDINLYYRSSKYLLEGSLPYQDFDLEYPPLAILAFYLPRIVTLGMPIFPHVYAVLFMVQNALFSTLNAFILGRLIRKINSQSQILALVFYTLFAATIAPAMLWRYDLFPTLLTVLSLFALIFNRSTLAGLTLGCGFAAKLYPIVLLPVFTAYYFANKSYRAILNLWLGTLAAVCLIFIPFLITTKNKLFSFLIYHKDRGLQIESLPAGIISLAHKWGFIEIKTIAGYGSRNIVSPLNDTVLNLLPWLLILIYSVMLINCFYRFREDRSKAELVKFKSLVAYTLLALLIFIITSKVFSPQYLVWIIPFAALLKPRQAGLMLAVCVTTYIMMSSGSFRNLDYVKILWLNLRNFLILGLSIWIFLDYLPNSIKILLTQKK